MRSGLARTVTLSILILLLAGSARAAISFTDGFWSTSFSGCTTGSVDYTYTCDGLGIVDDTYTCSGTQTQVNTSGNMAAGAGGNGLRVYMLGGSTNTMSLPAMLEMSAQPEIWFRFYYRIPSGQTNAGLGEHKLIFPFIGSSVSSPFDWPAQADMSMTMQGTMGNQDIYWNDGGGWDSVYGGPSETTPADGTWRMFEFHFKKPASGATGVFQAWVDGVNYVNKTDMDWGTDTGWTEIHFPSNHNQWQLSGCNPHDVDDIAVALPTYAGFVQDAQGRNMIGGLDAGPDTTPNAFSFTDQTGVALGSTNNSDNVTTAGFDNTTTLVLTGDASCKYSINGAAWATANDNITVGDNVALQNVASGAYSTAISCTLNLGGVTDTWSRTTLAATAAAVPQRFRGGSMGGRK